MRGPTMLCLACRSARWCCCAMAVAAISAGCGRDSGPPRYDLSGQVTYRGKPVPAGRIVFTPDTSQGNQGPATMADLTDGRYRTRPGKGAVAGPHRVTIIGADGTMATETHDNSLFAPYETSVTIDETSTTHDFGVPEQ